MDGLVIRDAEPDDVPALVRVRYNPGLHRDRIRDARGDAMRYLVVELAGRVVGFGCLVLSQPQTWPTMKHLPQLIDLTIHEALRSKGLGTQLICHMERLARLAGQTEMRLGVDAEKNPRAMSLYTRLGYEPIDSEPVEDCWEFTDSDGVHHGGCDQVIHMRKRLVGR